VERQIPGSDLRDAMGPYPLFACDDWSSLRADLQGLTTDLVTLALVPDPFGDYTPALLEKCFDRVKHFKDRYVVDLRLPAEKVATRHHRYYARIAAANVLVEPCPEPAHFAEEWIGLYAGLILRHGLKGIKAFSPKSLSEQLRVPGLVMFRALHRGLLAGMHLWYVQGAVAYSHLTALSDIGYRLGASYALYSFAIEWFGSRARWLDLGAGTGIGRSQTDGLSRFKRGWSTGTRPTYFCTRVYNRREYARLSLEKGWARADYFPAYREGEHS
jgi:hypothetical protein